MELNKLLEMLTTLSQEFPMSRHGLL